MKKRKFSRVSFHGIAHLDMASYSCATEVLNLSLKGALVKKPTDWPVAFPHKMQLRIVLNDYPIELTMQVSVAHQTDQVLGLHCEAIDIDSASHFRRLLQLNLGDADLLDLELQQLIEQQVS
ncbi:PilZ domain-containing protein [Rheinheimera salexigens]|uniref:Cyclic diguanosine monophosphate-binding protein n=1 Tax=Rheinheimera salexigens TaxID=1628148 RepID=A0A1E7Q939_9GAMM|nr:PilZ domain-containing protein [Rheinheimera salexigens]OEY70650.1 carbamoyl-phosphate synthase large subunit [Rheinheimera salexigens]